MLMGKAIEAFHIFMKYAPDALVESEHDVMFAGPDFGPYDITDHDDVIRLGELGWFWSDEYDCWSCFT